MAGGSAPSSRRTEGRSESRRDRFKRLAERRTKAVLAKLKVLGNCANKASYEYERQDVEKIFKAIEGKLREIKAKFSDAATDDEFKL